MCWCACVCWCVHMSFVNQRELFLNRFSAADLVEAMKETNAVTAYIMSKKVISSDLQKILSIYYQLSDLHVRDGPTHRDKCNAALD